MGASTGAQLAPLKETSVSSATTGIDTSSDAVRERVASCWDLSTEISGVGQEDLEQAEEDPEPDEQDAAAENDDAQAVPGEMTDCEMECIQPAPR